MSFEENSNVQFGGYGNYSYDSDSENPDQYQAISESLSSVTKDTQEEDTSNPISGRTESIETYKLFVRNLPPGILSSELLKLFQPYGKVVECEVFVKNYAFVHMANAECGMKAMKALDNKFINGSRINVQEARNKTIKIKHPIGSFGHQKVTTFKLFMSNLPPKYDDDTITQLLEPFGRVVEMNPLSSTSAFVHIENEECGKRAIEGLNGSIMDGNRSLIVSESTDPGGPNIPVMKLLIKNLSEKVSASQLRDLFNKYGMVIESKITPPSANDERKAVVHLEAIGDIRTALKEMNGYELDGHVLMVEPLLENETKNLEGSLKFKALEPGYGKSSKPPPLLSLERNKPRQNPRPLFGDQKQWRLIPMPSAFEEPPYHHGGNYRRRMHQVTPSRHGRGMGFIPRRRDRYDNYEFCTDNYDEFYEPPFQGSHGNSEPKGNDWFPPNTQAFQNYDSSDTTLKDQDFSPLLNKSKPRFGQLPSFNSQPTPLMDLPFDDSPLPSLNDFSNSFTRHPAPLNLPLGEKQYFSRLKKPNNSIPSTSNIPSLMDTNLEQQFQQSQLQSPHLAQQGSLIPKPNESGSFSQDSYALPGFYANDQIQGPNSNYWIPTTEINKNNFSLINNYNANNNLQAPPMFSDGQSQQSKFPPGVNPDDYPTLKPGAKVYINGKGKVMVRGNRGGKAKRRKPVMAVEMPSRANINKSQAFGRHPFQRNKQFARKKQDEQKIEYSAWLEKKPWLHEAIPGTVKRL